MGEIAFNGGIAKRLYDSAYKFIGHIPGGLAMATVAAASVFSSISGSTTATAATFSSVAIPEMDRYHYSRRLSTGIVAASGTLGLSYSAECPPYRLRHYYRTVDRETISGFRDSRIACSYIFYVYYLRVV